MAIPETGHPLKLKNQNPRQEGGKKTAKIVNDVPPQEKLADNPAA